MNSLVDDPPLAAPPTQADIIAQLQQSVSPSRLALFQSCRLKFFFRQVLRLRKRKTAALHVGLVVHDVLRAWNRARWRREVSSPHLLYAAYTAAWMAGQADEPVAWESPVEEEEQKQAGWRLAETFFRETTLRSTDKPDGVEVPVEAALSAHGLPRLVGVLDLVQAGRIIDFKTASQTPTSARAALLHATQVAAYALLYRENTGSMEAGVEIHHLVKLKQPRLVVIALPPCGEREQSRLFRIVDAYVAALERCDFIPSPGLQCAACEFFGECTAWPG